MAYTLRCNERQEKALKEAMCKSREKTVTGTIHHVVSQYPFMKERIKTLENEIYMLKIERNRIIEAVQRKIDADHRINEIAAQELSKVR